MKTIEVNDLTVCHFCFTYFSIGYEDNEINSDSLQPIKEGAERLLTEVVSVFPYNFNNGTATISQSSAKQCDCCRSVGKGERFRMVALPA